MTSEQQQRKRIVLTVLALLVLALAFYVSAFFKEWV